MTSQSDPKPNKGGNPILKAGGAQARAHQVAAGLRPKTNRTKVTPALADAMAKLPDSTEDMEAATLRLQRARADCEELDRQKREVELAKARAELITREEAADLSQAAVLRVVSILDRLPERIRDLGHPPTPEEVDEIIRAMRTNISQGEKP